MDMASKLFTFTFNSSSNSKNSLVRPEELWAMNERMPKMHCSWRLASYICTCDA